MRDNELKSVSLDVNMPEILDYATITGDFNPIHVDPAFAAKTPLGGVIAHGTLSMNLLWQVVAASFGSAACRGAQIDIRFVRPVRVGDRVTAGGLARADGAFDVWVRNQDGTPVIEGILNMASAQQDASDAGRLA